MTNHVDWVEAYWHRLDKATETAARKYAEFNPDACEVNAALDAWYLTHADKYSESYQAYLITRITAEWNNDELLDYTLSRIFSQSLDADSVLHILAQVNKYVNNYVT
jgi:hypothetical protein